MTANTVDHCEMSADLLHEKSFLAVFGRSSWRSVAAYRTNYESNYSTSITTEFIGLRMLRLVVLLLFLCSSFSCSFGSDLCWSFCHCLLTPALDLADVSPRLHMEKAVVVPALRFIAVAVAVVVVLAVDCIAAAGSYCCFFCCYYLFLSFASIFVYAIVSAANSASPLYIRGNRKNRGEGVKKNVTGWGVKIRLQGGGLFK